MSLRAAATISGTSAASRCWNGVSGVSSATASSAGSSLSSAGLGLPGAQAGEEVVDVAGGDVVVVDLVGWLGNGTTSASGPGSSSASGAVAGPISRVSSIDEASPRRAAGTVIGTGPVVGVRSTYSSGSPSGVSSATTSTATRRARSNACMQPIATVDELLDLLAGEVAPAGQLGEHPLAVGARLLDHLPALLLGHRQLGLGVGGGIGAAPAGFQLGLLAHALSLLAGLAQQPRGPLLGLGPDRRRALARRLQDARRLLAEQAGGRVVVDDRTAVGDGDRLRRPQLALEEALALLQPGQLGGDHAQEVAHLLLVEPAPGRAERGVGHGGRGGRVRAREGDGHRRERKRGGPPIRGNQSAGGERVAADALERGECLVERRDGDDLDVVAGDLPGPLELLVALARWAR